MNAQELEKELKGIDLELKPLQERVSYLEKRKKELDEIFRSSVMFNLENLAAIMAQLMTEKEKIKYAPLIFDRDDFTCSTYFFAISREDSIIDNKKKLYDECRHNQDLLKYKNRDNLILLCTETVDDNDLCFFKIKEAKRGFGWMIDKNIFDIMNRAYSYQYAEYLPSFDNFDYLYVFIEYLYDLQVRNNGKQLSLEDMSRALTYFLRMDEKTYNQYRNKVWVLNENKNTKKKELKPER